MNLPCLDVCIHTVCLCLHINDCLILLFNEHGHFLEHLGKLRKGLFNFLNLGMSLLHLPVCASSSTISVRV